MKQMLIALIIIALISWVYLGSPVDKVSMPDGSKETPIDASILVVAETKLASGNYSKRRLSSELQNEFSTDKVNEILSKLEVDYSQEAFDALSEYTMMNLDEISIRKQLIEVDLFEENEVEQAFLKAIN